MESPIKKKNDWISLHRQIHHYCFICIWRPIVFFPLNPIIRYGEHNPCFSVATFSNDNEEDKDVAKKVTSALERVTSDYHSGSSSDEESIRTSPLTVLNSRCPYQVCHYTINFSFMVLGIVYGDMGYSSLSRSWRQLVSILFPPR